MADDDDDKGIYSSKKIRAAKRELKELEAATVALHKNAKDRDKERIINYEMLQTAINASTNAEKDAIATRIEGLRELAKVAKGLEADILREKADSLEKDLDIDGAAVRAMGSALGLSAIFGVQVPKIKELIQDFAVSLDDARRSIVPFSTSIEDANNLQTKFKDVSTATKIPITESICFCAKSN